MTSCITCLQVIPSTDTEFFVAGTAYLKWKFQNPLQLFDAQFFPVADFSLICPNNFVCVWNTCCNYLHCSFPVILKWQSTIFSPWMLWQYFWSFHPLFSPTDMTDSFVWFILFLHSSDSFKFCFLHECIWFPHSLFLLSLCKISLGKASCPCSFLCYSAAKYKKATGMPWFCRAYNLKYDSL